MSNKTNGSDEDEDEDLKSRPSAIRERCDSTGSSTAGQSFYASFKIYINRLSGRFGEDSSRVLSRGGEDVSSSGEASPRVVVRIEKLGGGRNHSDDSDGDDDVFAGTPRSPRKDVPVVEKKEPETVRHTPPRPIAAGLGRDDREESPVFYLDPVDWVRVEGSSPVPVLAFPDVAHEPIHIPEVTISPTHRMSSSSNGVTCDHLNTKLLLSPPHHGCICGGRLHSPNSTKLEDPTKKRLRSRSYSSTQVISSQSGHNHSFGYHVDDDDVGKQVFRTTSSSGSYLTSNASRRDRISTTETLLGRNRRRKVAIPILCARAAAMVGHDVIFATKWAFLEDKGGNEHCFNFLYISGFFNI